MAIPRRQVASPRSAKTKHARLQALHGRMAGRSYRRIGEDMGVDHAYAMHLVRDALADLKVETDEAASEVRALEIARLDALWSHWWERLHPTKKDGTPRKAPPTLIMATTATQALLKVAARRAALLGLDIGIATDPPLPPPIRPIDLSKLTVMQLEQWREMLVLSSGQSDVATMEEAPSQMIEAGSAIAPPEGD